MPDIAKMDPPFDQLSWPKERHRYFFDPFPLEGQFDRALGVELIAVEQTDMAPVWDLLIEQYHPLGKREGIRIKQLAFIDNRPVAALGWSNPALHLETRDAFVGWDFHQKNANLGHVANNALFLILPWIRLKNLASHLLSRAVQALPSLWKGQTGKPLYLVETFVDETSYQGTCYQAANWLHLGHPRDLHEFKRSTFNGMGRPKRFSCMSSNRSFVSSWDAPNVTCLPPVA